MTECTKKPSIIKILVTTDVHYDVEQNYDVVDEATNNVDPRNSTDQIGFDYPGWSSLYLLY